MKRSRSLKRSQNATNEACRHVQQPQPWSDNDEKNRMIERRQNQARGEDICPECGGVIWNLGTCRRCGDCRCKF